MDIEGVTDFLQEETQPTQQNKFLCSLLTENILKPCFKGKKILILKIRFL